MPGSSREAEVLRSSPSAQMESPAVPPAGGADAQAPSVVALIPARDEASNLARLVPALLGEGLDAVYVVDNGSSDRTTQVARNADAVVIAEPRRGYGRACLAGMAALRERDPPPDVVVFLDGDGSDDPAQLHRLARPCTSGCADLVVGVRTGPLESEGRSGAGEGGGKARARLGTRLVLWLARRLHGLRSRDLGPFRAIRWEALDLLDMDDPTWGWTLQMQLRAHRAGLRIREVEVPRRARWSGASKVSGSLVMSARVGTRMFWTLARELVVTPRCRPLASPKDHGAGRSSSR